MTAARLLVTCHPSPTSLCANIAGLVQETLSARRIEVVVDDLSAIGFNPVVTAVELEGYFDREPPADIAPLIAHLRAAAELIIVLPIWNFDMPAQLKGYFDRLLRPHVAFELVENRVQPLLANIAAVSVVATHGMTRADCEHFGDWTTGFFAQSLPAILPGLKSNWRYDIFSLDAADPTAIERDLAAIRRHFAERG